MYTDTFFYSASPDRLLAPVSPAPLCGPLWPSGKTLGFMVSMQKRGPRLDSASALLSLQKGCGLWTLSCDFVPRNINMALIAAHLNAGVILVVTV